MPIRRIGQSMPTIASSIDDKPLYYIGKVADITGASCKAIRHYEELGLLPPPTRRGAYRVYTEKDIFMVHVIKHAQSYGFSLNELRDLLTIIAREKHFPIHAALETVTQKRESVRREAEALRLLDARLGELLDNIKTNFR